MATGMNQAEFERVRAQIKAEYDRILQARDWTRTAPQLLESMGPLKTVAGPIVQRVLDGLDELVKVGTDEYEKLAPVEWEFVTRGNHDASVWKQIRDAALQVERDVQLIQSDRARLSSAAAARGPRQRGPFDPNAAHPWTGLGGTAYAGGILPQATAARYVADLAQDTSEMMRVASENFGTMVAALKTMLQQIVMYWILLTVAVATLIRSILAAAAIAMATGGVGAAFAMAVWLPPILVFLGAAAQRMVLVTPAMIAFQNSSNVLRNFVSRRIEDMNTRMAAVPDVFLYESAAKWPDPTANATYPHVSQDRTGHYRIMTDVHHRMDTPNP